MRRPSLSAPAFLAVALVAAAPLQAAAPPAPPKPPAPPAEQPLPSPRVRIVLNGVGSFTSPSFGDTRQYAEYAETTSVSTSYSTKTAFGPDVAVQLSLVRGLGVLVGYSLASRSESGRFDASRPHPLYLNRPRSLSGELSGYDYKEGALQLDLAYGRGSGRLDWSLFAGASVFQVEADLLSQLTFTDSYPYDQLTLVAAPATRVKATPTGWNVGGRLDYRFGRSFGAGVLVRYSKASVKLRANQDAGEASFDAGGLQAGAGVRLYF